MDPDSDSMTYRLEGAGGSLYSVNAVGYYHLTLPPGHSLIAYQFVHTNRTLGFQWPDAPDGAQLFKFTDGLGYEVSTYDAQAAAWSNPDLELTLGDAYYFRNPTAEPVIQLFVGEVPEGVLVNSIPAGLSAKASIIPHGGPLTAVFQLPGEDGDEVSLYVNDGAGGGAFETSVFSESDNSWVPDLSVRVGEGFWIRKRQPADWTRVFHIN